MHAQKLVVHQVFTLHVAGRGGLHQAGEGRRAAHSYGTSGDMGQRDEASRAVW